MLSKDREQVLGASLQLRHIVGCGRALRLHSSWGCDPLFWCVPAGRVIAWLSASSSQGPERQSGGELFGFSSR
eukprot:5731798-Amphidinium_carterae.1